MGVLNHNMQVLNAIGGAENVSAGGNGNGGVNNVKPKVVAPRKNTTRMDDFTILRKLGKGSFGVVYAVTRKRDPNKRTLVVKEIKMGPRRSEQEEAINECRVLAKLDSRYVVKYFDSFVEAGSKLCIVMEYAPKGTVHRLIQTNKPRPLDESLVWKLMLQSTLGLHHIHQLKVLHRDIKSENIFLDAGGNAKIGDLGVAKVMTTQVDFARTLVGTPYYLSPELCENKPYNHKSDIWSLGCVLYEMLTGTHPFNATNQGALFIKILKGKYPPVKGYGADITAMLDRCLALSAARRLDAKGILASKAAHEKALEIGLELPVDIPLPTSAAGGVITGAGLAAAAAAAGGVHGGVKPTVPPGSGGVVMTVPKRPGPGGGMVGARARAPAAAAAATPLKRSVGDRAAVEAFVNAPPGVAGNGVRSAAVAAGIAAAAVGGGAAGKLEMQQRLLRRKAEADRRLRAAAVAREKEEAAKAAAVAAGWDPMVAVREQRARQFEADNRSRAAAKQRERVAAAAAAADAAKAKLAAAKAAIHGGNNNVDTSPYAARRGVVVGGAGGRAAAMAAAGRSPAPGAAGAGAARRRVSPSTAGEAAAGEVAACRALYPDREPPAAALAAAAYAPKSPPRNLYRPPSAAGHQQQQQQRPRPQSASATMRRREAEEKADAVRAERARKLRERDMAAVAALPEFFDVDDRGEDEDEKKKKKKNGEVAAVSEKNNIGDDKKEQSPTRAMWGGAAAYIKPLADAKDAKTQLSSQQQQQQQQRVIPAGALPGGGGGGGVRGGGGGPSARLYEPKQRRPAAAAGVRRSAEGGKVDIAAARKAAADASRAAVRASRPKSAVTAAVPPSSTAAVSAAATQQELEASSTTRVEFAPPAVRATQQQQRPKTAAAAVSSSTSTSTLAVPQPASPPLMTESSMVPVMTDDHEVRTEALRAERARRLRERDVAAVAALPDFSSSPRCSSSPREDQENGRAPGGGGEGGAAGAGSDGGGWGGASAYIRPRMMEQNKSGDAAAAGAGVGTTKDGAEGGVDVVVPGGARRAETTSTAAAAAAAVDAYMKLSGRERHDPGARPQMSTSAAAGVLPFQPPTNASTARSITTLSDHPSSIHGGTSTAAPEELAAAVAEVTTMAAAEMVEEVQQLAERTTEDDGPQASATSPRQTLKKGARSRLIAERPHSSSSSRPASASAALQRSSLEQRRSVRSSLERFEERRSLRRSESLESGGSGGGGGSNDSNNDGINNNDDDDSGNTSGNGSDKEEDKEGKKKTTTTTNKADGDDDVSETAVAMSYEELPAVVVSRTDLAFRFGGSTLTSDSQGISVVSSLDLAAAVEEERTREEGEIAEELGEEEEDVVSAVGGEQDNVYVGRDGDDEKEQPMQQPAHPAPARRPPTVPALPSGGGGKVKAVTGKLAFNFGGGGGSTEAQDPPPPPPLQAHTLNSVAAGADEKNLPRNVVASSSPPLPIMHGADDAGSVVWRVMPEEVHEDDAGARIKEFDPYSSLSRTISKDVAGDECNEGGKNAEADANRALGATLRATLRVMDEQQLQRGEDEDDDGVYDDDEDWEGEEEEDEADNADADAQAEAAFVEEHGMTRRERTDELVEAMTHTEQQAISLVGAEAFGLLYDFLARRAEAIDEGRLDEEGAAGSIAELSRLVFSIIPHEKAEAVTLAYRYMYLVGQLENVDANSPGKAARRSRV